MIKEKWLDYAISTLKLCNFGTKSIKSIHSDIGGSRSYIAKVVAKLRNADLINERYELTKNAKQITVREVIEAGCASYKTPSKICKIILKTLEIPITKVW